MTEVLQIHQTTPELLVQTILKAVEEKFNEFKKDFQRKDNDLLSRKEAAKLLKVNESTIHNWVASGKVKKYLKGNKAYYKKQEILDSLVVIDNAK